MYVVRHGETQWNVEKKVQGHADIELNDKGKAQAQDLGSVLQDIHFDAVFSSDLLRAKQTAEIALLQKNITIQTTQALRERYFGRLQGKNWAKKDAELQLLWGKISRLTDEERTKYDLVGVENDENIINRFIPFLREIAVAYTGKTVLVVTHNGVMRLLVHHVGYPGLTTGHAKVNFKNSGYIKLVSDGVEFDIKELKGIETI